MSEPVDSNYTSQAGAGRLYIDNDDLYFSVGYSEKNTKDNGRDVPASQNTKSNLGKIFKYHIPTKKIQMVSLGHRNVQGIAKANNGDILATEQGPQGGDEINLIRSDLNYGWPFHTYGTNYGSYKYISKWIQFIA